VQYTHFVGHCVLVPCSRELHLLCKAHKNYRAPALQQSLCPGCSCLYNLLHTICKDLSYCDRKWWKATVRYMLELICLVRSWATHPQPGQGVLLDCAGLMDIMLSTESCCHWRTDSVVTAKYVVNVTTELTSRLNLETLHILNT